jgi:hypothetical protein
VCSKDGLADDAAAEVWRRIRSVSRNPAAMAAFHQITQESGR